MIGAGAATWKWRADRWAQAVCEAPGGFWFKSNVLRLGERIYHKPWSSNYGRTVIDTAGRGLVLRRGGGAGGGVAGGAVAIGL